MTALASRRPRSAGPLARRALDGRVGDCYPRFMADDTQAELERLRAENERLKKAASRGGSIRVSEKGGVSVYGLGRFPVTLYKEQWLRLLDMADEIRGFIRDNDDKLKAKS
jgi:hypothetical protein